MFSLFNMKLAACESLWFLSDWYAYQTTRWIGLDATSVIVNSPFAHQRAVATRALSIVNDSTAIIYRRFAMCPGARH